MCSVYVNADPIQYEARTRSLRINHVLTTIRLENLFWDVLCEMAGREGKTTNQMVAALHEELFIKRGDNPNFTSFLRVCCLRYLSLAQVADDRDEQRGALRVLMGTDSQPTPHLTLHSATHSANHSTIPPFAAPELRH